MENLLANGIEHTIFFYNPNIHPRQEYEIRKQENQRFANQLKIPMVDADYEVTEWLARTRGLEWAPERGQRCEICFDLRLERTASYAQAHGFKVFTSSLGLSRWKDLAQVNRAGLRAAARYPGLTYWTFPWRQQGGAQRAAEIAKREHFYQQQYCGCIYSLREINHRRQQQGREPLKISTQQHIFQPTSFALGTNEENHESDLPQL